MSAELEIYATPRRELTEAPPDTVYAHVERTVHALLGSIDRLADRGGDLAAADVHADRIETLARSVQALSSWPQFNPMNAHADYQKLAEYEVRKALEQYRNGPLLPACSCGAGIKVPEPWHADDCSGRSYQR